MSRCLLGRSLNQIPAIAFPLTMQLFLFSVSCTSGNLRPQILWPINFIQISFSASVLLWNTCLSQTHIFPVGPERKQPQAMQYASIVGLLFRFFYPAQGNPWINILWWRPYSTQRTAFPLVIQWWNCSLQEKMALFHYGKLENLSQDLCLIYWWRYRFYLCISFALLRCLSTFSAFFNH